AGADLSWKLSPTQRLQAFALESMSRAPTQTQSEAGFGTQVRYSYETKAWTVSSHFEHYDRDFRMDTAFLNRVGDTQGWLCVERDFYPDQTKSPWLRKVQPFSFTQATRDRVQQGDELFSLAGLRLFFTRQGFFRVDYLGGHEPFAGHEFKNNRWRMQSNAQIF